MMPGRKLTAVLFSLGLLLTMAAPAVTAEPGDSGTREPQQFQPERVSVEFEEHITGFTEPVYVTHAGDGSGRLFIVERPGVIKISDGGEVLDEPFLDISDQVITEGSEQGLFSIAFHPDYEQNGMFFVVYASLPDGNNVLARFQVSDDPNRADASSQLKLFSLTDQYPNHNGGDIAFSPADGYLYYGLGDGGGGGDPEGNAQDPRSLFGKMLRINPSTEPNPAEGEVYTVPEDNPFVGNSDYRPEIWAVGLRNPWRYSFDRETGDLYIGDVGQADWEELNFQPADSDGGANYGWSILEGNHCYPPDTSECNQQGLTLPIIEYPQDAEDGSLYGCSITAGEVYRGEQASFMDGKFIYGDWCSGRVWMTYRDEGGNWREFQLADTDMQISSFGTDAMGELYLTDMLNGNLVQVHFDMAGDGANEFGNEDFEDTWNRTDRPVAADQADRTWMWGPDAFTNALTEEYAQSPGSQRTVQYFDKARMEINDPDADPNSDWYVTNGLLVVELITGRMQVGDDSFETREPAEVVVAGDAGADTPTYATLAGLLDADPREVDTVIDERLAADGTVSEEAGLADRDVTAGYHDEVTDHTVATPFWAFMNSSGTIYQGGEYVAGPLFPNPYYATGRPITEAYWATVPVGGEEQDVLLQCFERRCLTYTPGNEAGWQVEAGNVGQHYYEWRY